MHAHGVITMYKHMCNKSVNKYKAITNPEFRISLIANVTCLLLLSRTVVFVIVLFYLKVIQMINGICLQDTLPQACPNIPW